MKLWMERLEEKDKQIAQLEEDLCYQRQLNGTLHKEIRKLKEKIKEMKR